MLPQPFISARKYIKWGDEPAGETTDTLVLTTPLKNYTDVRLYLPISSTTLPLSKLEWAFAGPSHSTPASGGKPQHTIWTHWVDSKTTEEIKDEGDMHPQSNGEVLEYGTMVNPGKGVEEKYEECWIDLEVDGEKKGWVLKVEDKGEGVKGMLVRIGGTVQGVLRRVADISVGRWKDGEKVVGIGEIQIPEVADVVNEGDKVVGKDGLAWICVESFEWE